MKKHFKNKVVVVTGAASGIGKAICERFALDEVKLGLLDMDSDGVEAYAAELNLRGVEAVGIKCDVSNEQECFSSIAKIQEKFGGIDILFNNAGITQRDLFVNTDVAVYRKVMDVNFFGALYCTKAAMDSIVERRGSIIATSSAAGFGPVLARTGYCASKHALHGFFDTLRCEVKDLGVHVMLICPTFVETNLQKRALGGDGKVTSHAQSTIGRIETADAISMEIYQSVLHRRPLVLPSNLGKIAFMTHRFLPGIYEKIMFRQFKQELDR